MGVAIFLVVLYHSGIKLFYIGFIGVDIFLFLSGYRLCGSYERQKTLGVFYKKRLLRILPLFSVLAICHSIINFIKNDCSFFDFVCNITTLSYYNLGGHIFDWYLCALVLFYFAFPILYYLVKKCPIGVLAATLTGSLVLLTLGLPWYYDTAIGRIPIFTLGIICFSTSINRKILYEALGLFGGAFVTTVLLYYLDLVHTYVLIYILAPFVFYVIAVLSAKIVSSLTKLSKAMEYLGSHSLELYVSNNISMVIAGLILPPPLPRSLDILF